ncbi:MAG: DUF4352 domain-containing protein [Dehalococcoidia bacterium]
MLTIASGLIGCTSGGNDSAKTTPGDDQTSEPSNEDQLAESMLLLLSDFPTGWAEEPESDEDSPFDDCTPDTPAGRMGRAATGSFSSGGSDSISQSLATFETPDQANAAEDDRSSIGDCLVEVVEAGRLDDQEAAYSDASFSPLSFPAHGDRTDAYRLKVHVAARGETGFGSEADVYIDVVNVLIDRVGFAVQAQSVFSPFDSDELDGYVSLVESRVRERLAASGSKADDEQGSPEDIPVAAPTASPTVAEQPSIGDKVEASGGISLIVYSYDAPVTSANEFSRPDPGNIFAAIDVEMCTGANPPESASVNPFDFRLQMPDNSRLEPGISAKEPELNSTNLLANDCVRGWVTFEVPEGVAPQFVVYEGYDADFDPLIIKWSIGP